MSHIEGRASDQEDLDEIMNSYVLASVEDGQGFKSIRVELPNNPSFGGEVEDIEIDRGVSKLGVFLLSLEVDPRFRRNGIGTRLMSSMAYVAKTESCGRLFSAVTSPHTVRMFKTLFNEESVTFYDDDPSNRQRLEIPMTLDQAIMSLERMESHSIDGKVEEAFSFLVELGEIALSDLEEPIVIKNIFD